jgi:glycosyltransferase involved in cell wall biosynthesis
VVNLARAQKAHAGIDPFLITMVPGASSDFVHPVDGIECHFVKVPARLRAATLFEFERRTMAARAKALRPDFVHAHGTEESHVLSAQRTGCPYVVSLQGVFAIINRVLPPPLVSRARIIEHLEKRALGKVRDVIAKSDYIEREIARLFPHLAIHRIPNTFDPRLLEIPPQQRQPRSICFVGMVTPRKGLDCLADALERLGDSDMSLHIVGNAGDAASAYEESILSRFRRLLGERLVLHGKVSSLEVARIMAGCEILAAPSLEEMFGNQVVEALLMGTLPVVSSGTAMEETVKKAGEGLVFEKGDAGSLAAGMSEAFRRVAGAQWRPGRQAIIEWMGPKAVASAHLALYKSILGEA